MKPVTGKYCTGRDPHLCHYSSQEQDPTKTIVCFSFKVRRLSNRKTAGLSPASGSVALVGDETKDSQLDS